METLDTDVFALKTHPFEPFLAVGTLTGHVSSYYYKTEEWTCKRVWHTQRHRKACRDLVYTWDGRELISVGADRVIKRANSETGQVIWKIRDAHTDAINVVCCVFETVFATGDDSGCVKLWDSRTDTCIREVTIHVDFISSFLPLDKTLLSTSGDASFSVLDLRTSKSLPVISEDQENDLLSSCLLKTQSKKPKICIGTASGIVKIFNKGDWNVHLDQILLPKKKDMFSIDAMIAWDDDIIIVGGSDGVIRALNIHPNRQLGIIGHQDSGIDVLAKTHDAKWILSGGGEKICAWKIKWDVNNDKNDELENGIIRQPKKNKKKIMLDKNMSFFADLT